MLKAHSIILTANKLQELAALPRKYEYYFMPNKSQVLFYLSDASLLRIRRAGTELQVTDSIDFPLFDIWMESNCAKSTMVLESYGKTVLLISESLGIGCLLRRKSEPPVDSDKRTIAKVLATENAYGRATVWVCILEGSGREIARFEDYSTIYFTKDVGGFQLKLLALAAFARLAATECIQTQSCCCSFLSLLFRC
ncbi:unnamed protein product [Gongylonema pulchrum]|uniref:CNH domain-containing protein n=1 Tax=Gongylonema pulchrum TaxID=637853 RepID=A0A183DYF2_9BILA|nr:unnamed protein product [Gongylonema pulchrum]